MPEVGTIGRLELPLTDEQAQLWAQRVAGQVAADPQSRGPRWWALALGHKGANLERILDELGEPAPPRGRPAVMSPRRHAHWRRVPLEAYA